MTIFVVTIGVGVVITAAIMAVTIASLSSKQIPPPLPTPPGAPAPGPAPAAEAAGLWKKKWMSIAVWAVLALCAIVALTAIAFWVIPVCVHLLAVFFSSPSTWTLAYTAGALAIPAFYIIGIGLWFWGGKGSATRRVLGGMFAAVGTAMLYFYFAGFHLICSPDDTKCVQTQREAAAKAEAQKEAKALAQAQERANRKRGRLAAEQARLAAARHPVNPLCNWTSATVTLGPAPAALHGDQCAFDLRYDPEGDVELYVTTYDNHKPQGPFHRGDRFPNGSVSVVNKGTPIKALLQLKPN